MTHDNEQNFGLERSFARSLLPWIVAAGALALYLATLNQWVTSSSIVYVAKLAGWNWQPTLTAPLQFVVTYPLHFLPVHIQPIALNALSAVFAALTLALLARSVALLPHDRTKDQRMREPGDYSLLSTPSAWIAPLIAVFVCGFQYDFWENATSGTGEMLNLLFLAYVVRCILEYRIWEKDSWLVRMAFAYGLAVTNNWAMIGLFPFALISVIWIKGTSFLDGRFFFKMMGAGLAGLALYLVLPIIASSYNYEALDFWTALKINLGQQKQMVTNRGFQWPFIIMSVTSLLPLLLLAIRWPSSSGDFSALGNIFSNIMFRLSHLGFFAVCIVVFYEPDFIQSQLEDVGISFLSLRYLSALCIGYFAGYLLLVFGVAPQKSWSKPNAFDSITRAAVVGLVWIALLAIPILFIARNFPKVRFNNSPALKNYAKHLVESLPQKAALVLSDDPIRLWLVNAYCATSKTPMPHIPIHTAAMPFILYHQYLEARHPQLWTPVPKSINGKPTPEPLPDMALLQCITQAALNHPVYYLHPSFGYYFEVFYAVPSGQVMELKRYGKNQFNTPPMTDAELDRNLEYWKSLGTELSDLKLTKKSKNFDAAFIVQSYSRIMNTWGVVLQQNNRLKEAGQAFANAIEINRDNLVAQVNLSFNKQLQGNKTEATVVEKDLDNKMRKYRTWDTLLNIHGPFDDPNYSFYLGQLMIKTGLYRQAAHYFQRAKLLNKNSIEPELMLGEVYLESRQTDRVLAFVQEARQSGNRQWLNSTNRLELLRLEALAYFTQTNNLQAQTVLKSALSTGQKDPATLAVVAHVYLTRNMLAEALQIIDMQLALQPANAAALLNKSVALMQLKDNKAALVPLGKLLEQQPDNYPARMNRAIAHLQLNMFDEARKDYQYLLQSFPTMFAVHFGLGEIAYRKQDKRAAIKHYENYLKHAPKGTQERTDVEARLKQLKG